MTKRPELDGIYCAPYGEADNVYDPETGKLLRGIERWPTSKRTGRMVSQSVAEAEFAQNRDGIGTEEHPGGGLWDFEQEAEMRSAVGCRTAHAPARYDSEAMQRWADRHSHKLTDRELQVYVMFWGGRLSYGQIGRHLGIDKERVREAVQRLRAKADAAGVARPDWRRA